MISPLPYGVQWTSKLIRRDFRDLKSKFRVSSSKSVKTSPRLDAAPFVKIAEEPLDLQHAILESSIETGSAEMIRDDSSRLSTASTALTEMCDVPFGVASKPINNLYELLDTKLKAMYASRDRNMPHDERWQLRGSCLVLSMALQACPSHPIHDIFRDEKSALNETGLLLDVIQYSTSKMCGQSARKASQVPSTPCTRYNDHLRYDSSFSTISFKPEASQATMKSTKTLSPVHLWYTILEAATDESKTVSITEGLLGRVWPDKNIVETLDRIGHPGKVFRDDEFAELRLKFREMLFPGYNDLINNWQLRLGA